MLISVSEIQTMKILTKTFVLAFGAQSNGIWDIVVSNVNLYLTRAQKRQQEKKKEGKVG